MGSDNTAISQWGSLFDSAMRIKQLAPWEWMSETDIFGVKNPESDEFGFVSIMGEAGEHFGVALYRGYRALYDFFNLQFDEEQKQYEYPELLLEIPQIQASFEDRADLEPWDYQLIRKHKHQPNTLSILSTLGTLGTYTILALFQFFA